MTWERASEIERKVFYRYMETIVPPNATAEVMFDIGHTIGRMHETLVRELNMEIKEREKQAESEE